MPTLGLCTNVTIDTFAKHSVALKGERCYNARRVVEFQYDPVSLECNGKVLSSFDKKDAGKPLLRTVSIRLTPTDPANVAFSHCSCLNGMIDCTHKVAMLCYLRDNVSKTDLQNCKFVDQPPSWNGQKIADIYQPSTTFAVALSESDRRKAIETFIELLAVSENPKPFYFQVKEVPQPVSRPDPCSAPLIKDVIAPLIGSNNSMITVAPHLVIQDVDIVRIALSTSDQRNNTLWMLLRDGRITGSVVGHILEFMNKHPNATEMSKTLRTVLFSTEVKGQALVYGIHHEKDAVEAFERRFGQNVKRTGIWLSRNGWFGSSPDGLVGNDSVLEVKCPYSLRNVDIKEALKNARNGTQLFVVNDSGKKVNLPIEKNEKGILQMVKSHPYFHQVQAHCFVTGRKRGFFFIWTPSGSLMAQVPAEPLWKNNMMILEHFYFNVYLNEYIALMQKRMK